MELIITDNITEALIDDTISFVLKQKQLYPNFNEWVYDKLKPRLLNGDCKGTVIISDNKVVGNCLYYDYADKIEIKNLRIDKDYRNLYLGKMLLSSISHKNITTDISVENFNAVKFFMMNGFEIEYADSLYRANQLEYIIRRSI